MEWKEYNKYPEFGDTGPFEMSRTLSEKGQKILMMVIRVLVAIVALAYFGLVIYSIIKKQIFLPIVGFFGLLAIILTPVGIVYALVRKQQRAPEKSKKAIIFLATIVNAPVESPIGIKQMDGTELYEVSINDYPLIISQAYSDNRYIIGQVVKVRIDPKNPNYCFIAEVVSTPVIEKDKPLY
jgi:hypothetical protein